MPFIKPSRRDMIELHGPAECEEVGDICYVFYKWIMRAWRDEPRWRTAHRLRRLCITNVSDNAYFSLVHNALKDRFTYMDILTASELAYSVFFVKHVMKYEDEKETENGQI